MNNDKISITYSEGLSLALFIQHAKRVRCVIFSSVDDMVLPNFSILSLTGQDFRGKII